MNRDKRFAKMHKKMFKVGIEENQKKMKQIENERASSMARIHETESKLKAKLANTGGGLKKYMN